MPGTLTAFINLFSEIIYHTRLTANMIEDKIEDLKKKETELVSKLEILKKANE